MRPLHILTLILVLISAPVFAGTPIELTLPEGYNEFTFSLSNIWNRDIEGLTVEIDTKALPSGVNNLTEKQSFQIMRGQRGLESLVLRFDVSHAPVNRTEIPLIFTDNKGNQWKYALILNINGSDSGPQYIDALFENYPNPFNPSTTIKYSLKENRRTELIIYNITGQKIRTLVNSMQNAGNHIIQWDGRDDSGYDVSSGYYFYKLESGILYPKIWTEE